MAVYLDIKQITEIQNAIHLSILTLENAKMLSSDKTTEYRKKVESKIYVQDLEWFLQNTDIKSLKSAAREFRRFKKQKYRMNISQ